MILLGLIFGIIHNTYGQGISREQDNALHIAITAYAITAAVDLSTTQYGLGKGIVHEANPIQKYFTDKGPVVSGIAKASMHVGVVWYLKKRHEYNPKAVLWTTIGLIGAQVLVDYNNYKAINKCPSQCSSY